MAVFDTALILCKVDGFGTGCVLCNVDGFDTACMLCNVAWFDTVCILCNEDGFDTACVLCNVRAGLWHPKHWTPTQEIQGLPESILGGLRPIHTELGNSCRRPLRMATWCS